MRPFRIDRISEGVTDSRLAQAFVGTIPWVLITAKTSAGVSLHVGDWLPYCRKHLSRWRRRFSAPLTACRLLTRLLDLSPSRWSISIPSGIEPLAASHTNRWAYQVRQEARPRL